MDNLDRGLGPLLISNRRLITRLISALTTRKTFVAFCNFQRMWFFLTENRNRLVKAKSRSEVKATITVVNSAVPWQYCEPWTQPKFWPTSWRADYEAKLCFFHPRREPMCVSFSLTKPSINLPAPQRMPRHRQRRQVRVFLTKWKPLALRTQHISRVVIKPCSFPDFSWLNLAAEATQVRPVFELRTARRPFSSLTFSPLNQRLLIFRVPLNFCVASFALAFLIWNKKVRTYLLALPQTTGDPGAM